MEAVFDDPIVEAIVLWNTGEIMIRVTMRENATMRILRYAYHYMTQGLHAASSQGRSRYISA